jgi:hypothetical protein
MPMTKVKSCKMSRIPYSRIGNGSRLLTRGDRSYRTAAHSGWKASSLAAASKAVPGLELNGSEDAKLLLLLLCFLGQPEIPLDLLSSGASSRMRWNKQGGLDESTALVPGLLPELIHICSHPRALDGALSKLGSLAAVSRNAQTCSLDRHVRDALSSVLPIESRSVWRIQAFIVAYRSIPWKYLER